MGCSPATVRGGANTPPVHSRNPPVCARGPARKTLSMKYTAFVLIAAIALPTVRAAEKIPTFPNLPRVPFSNPSQADQQDAHRLWIVVHVPKTTNPLWVGDDMSASFGDIAARALRTQGYQGLLGTLRPESPTPVRAPVLEIHLQKWSAKNGLSDCEFTASIRTEDGDKDMGYFIGDNVVVTANGQEHFSSDGLEGSALEAVDDLYNRIRATGLLH